jgi:hypothetical protein
LFFVLALCFELGLTFCFVGAYLVRLRLSFIAILKGECRELYVSSLLELFRCFVFRFLFVLFGFAYRFFELAGFLGTSSVFHCFALNVLMVLKYAFVLYWILCGSVNEASLVWVCL